MNEPKVSVIIPVRNEADKMIECLESIYSQSLKPFEVIIIDGHSTDGTVENARKFPVKIVYEDYHTRGGARQVGLENSEGEYVAFTDASCVPHKDWLRKLVDDFHDDIVGVGGRTLLVNQGFWPHSIDLAFSTFIGSANSVQGRVFKNKRTVSSISGCNCMYLRHKVIDVGGFSLNWGSEDSELNSRLLKVGRLIYTPEAVIIHSQGKGLKELSKQMYRWGGARIHTHKFEIQLAPPFLVPFLFLSLIFTYWILCAALALYLVIILLASLKIAIQEKDIRYLFSIPVIYIVEHSSYTVGFWREIFRPHKKIVKNITSKVTEQ